MASTPEQLQTHPLMQRALAERARLQDVADFDRFNRGRALDILSKLNCRIQYAATEAPIILGPYSHLSTLSYWLREWAAAIDACCWPLESDHSVRPAESYVPQVAA
jgi:hypothetical protein